VIIGLVPYISLQLICQCLKTIYTLTTQKIAYWNLNISLIYICVRHILHYLVYM
jgi:hypothetical protein